MNLNHLEYLITVAENGSINRAAQALYVSQPYLSGVIKSVEEELGFPVFRRSSTGVEPTELGVQALEGAKRILLELEQMRALKGQRPQSLRIASVYSPFFMKCFLEMRAKLGAQPQDSFQEMPPIECLQQLTSQQVDLALLVFLSGTKPYYQKRAMERRCQLHNLIGNVPVQVMMRAGHPLAGQEGLSLEQLREFPFVFYGDNESFSLLRRLQLGDSPNLITVSDRGSYFDILQSGDYLSVIALIGRSGPVRSDFCYIPLKNPKLVMDFAYATRNGEQLSEREKQFLRFSLSHSIANVS